LWWVDDSTEEINKQFLRYHAPMKQLLLLMSASMLVLTSCEEGPKKHGVVNFLHYRTAMPLLPHNQVEMVWHSDDSVRTHGSFRANETYGAILELWESLANPTFSGRRVHEEIRSDAKYHQVFYKVSEGLDLTIRYADCDENGHPIGILTEIVVGQPSTGQLTITVLHSPDKFAAGVSDGDITNAGGISGVECTFDVEIQ
jgi:hypothetical protein